MTTQPEDDHDAKRETGEGRTQPVQSHGSVPRLPHERDESDDSQSRADPRGDQKHIGEQAFDDVVSGQADTGRLPVTDETYDRLTKPER